MADTVDVVMAILGELEIPEDDEGKEAYLLDIAEACGRHVLEEAERWVRASRLRRGACPECGGRLAEVKEPAFEWHPYGMGWAAEDRSGVRVYECVACGERVEAEEVREPVW